MNFKGFMFAVLLAFAAFLAGVFATQFQCVHNCPVLGKLCAVDVKMCNGCDCGCKESGKCTCAVKDIKCKCPCGCGVNGKCACK